MKVFLSSTAQDLGAHRQVADDTILRLLQQSVVMERFGPLPGEPVEECERKARECDVVVCIVAHRYGFVPEKGRGSITRREVEAAKAAGKDVLVWIVADDHPWTEKKEQDLLTDPTVLADPVRIAEVAEGVRALGDFKAWLRATFVVETFTTPDDLGRKLAIALSTHARRAGSRTPERNRITTRIRITIERADALEFSADVLALKYAQDLFGVDEAVVSTLEAGGIRVRESLPPPSGFRFRSTEGLIGSASVLFLGVSPLRSFDYQGIREFAKRVLMVLAGQYPKARHVCLTIHGVGYGLDESEAFKAEIAGLLDAIASGDYPESLEQITIVERNSGRAARLSMLLASLLSNQKGAYDSIGSPLRLGKDARQALESAGIESQNKPYAFVAMPFAAEFDDLFHYGIQGAVNAAGYLCERPDLAAFTGDVTDWIKDRIANSTLLIADLTSANPNVYLEVGYAWGKGVLTVLLANDAEDLEFDVRGQRCLIYKNIRHLEECLRSELEKLRQQHPELRK